MVMKLFRAQIDTPIGAMVAMASGEGLTLLEFGDRPALPAEIAELEGRYGCVIERGCNAVLRQTEIEIRDYFAGRRTKFEIPLVMPGNAFQHEVWSKLREIPYGETRSYGSMACAMGRPNASRAVGAANGQNRIAIVVPCHRVIGADGSLTGYGGGQRRKRYLIDLEHRVSAEKAVRPVFHPITAQGSLF